MAKRINNSITISANVPVRTLASIHLHLKKKYGVVEKSKSGLIRKCVEAVAETISKEDSFEGTQDAFDYLQKEFGGFAVHRHGILKDVDMEEALEKKFHTPKEVYEVPKNIDMAGILENMERIKKGEEPIDHRVVGKTDDIPTTEEQKAWLEKKKGKGVVGSIPDHKNKD